jgi:hypothetical protein
MFEFRYASLCLALAVAVAGCGSPGAAGAQDWQTLNSSRRVSGEDVLRVNVEYGAGTLTIEPGERGMLYRSNLRYDASVFTPVVDYADGRLRVGMSGTQMRGRNIRGGELDLQFSPDVPLQMSLQFGAAEATLELGGLAIRDIDVQTGASRTDLRVSQPNRITCESAQISVGAAKFAATGLGNLNARRLGVKGGVGEMTLDFTGEWQADMDARVEMGLGSLTLRMPRHLAVSITRSGVLTSFDGEGLTKRGNSYFSQNWDSADRKLSLNLDAALGSIRVVWVDS